MIAPASPKHPRRLAAPQTIQNLSALDSKPAATEVRLSVVIPVYNSEATIASLGREIIRTLRPICDLQLILVNDGSSDGSASACRTLHEENPTIVDYLELSTNRGEQHAVFTGLKHSEGDYCVIIDDDFQNPPDEIPKLLATLQDGYDVVYSRYHKKQHSAIRNLASVLHNFTSTVLLGKPIGLYLSSFKIVSRPLLTQIVRYPARYPHIDAIILRLTRNIGVTSVRHAPRRAGTSGYTFAKLFQVWSTIAFSYSSLPAHLAALCSLTAYHTLSNTGSIATSGLVAILVGVCANRALRQHLFVQDQKELPLAQHMSRRSHPHS